MTKEKKELLIKDLCARLLCGVKLKRFDGEIVELTPLLFATFAIENFKPYLRSIYTMTDEEAKEYLGMLNDIDKSGLMNQNFITKVVDWLDKKMFDHRGLIPKGIALEAPEGMY